jgi:type I restriction enzyme S subunit
MVNYLRAANVKDGRLALDDILTMNFDPTEQEVFGLRPGDVLVSEGCGSLSQIGASASWHAEVPGTVCFQNTLLRLRAKDGVTTPSYLDHLARHAFRSGWWARIASGTNIFHIGLERAKRFPVPVPSLDEQKRATELLNVLSACASRSGHVHTALIDLRSALLDGLLSGDHEIPAAYDELLSA